MKNFRTTSLADQVFEKLENDITEFGVLAASAIKISDTAFDVTGAAAHGIKTIGVSWGYGKVADMERSGAVAIAHTMEELEQYINQ